MLASVLEHGGERGRLAENVMHFARLLRGAGLRVGPHKVLDALAALQLAGMERREDFYWTLAAVFIDKHEQQMLFDQAFELFWRDPKLTQRAMLALLPQVQGRMPKEEHGASQRLLDALRPSQSGAHAPPAREQLELDAALTFSATEVLRRMDFETMSAQEWSECRRLIAKLSLPLPEVATRRHQAHPRGPRVDMRATLRASLRGGSGAIALRWRQRASVHPPLVVLCDVSGSMTRYARMFLYFLHALTNERERVHSFVFGTRLTNISRLLRHRDVDVAMERIADVVADWAGGTRIGACLQEFNQRWSRRVLGQNAIVLLISDGLDREVGRGIGAQMQRLQLSCRELIWLNPLLRYDQFEPKAAGVKAMLPHVDRFLPVHNLVSLEQLITLLSGARRGNTRRPLAQSHAL